MLGTLNTRTIGLTASTADVARRRYARGDSFAYLRFGTRTLDACACGGTGNWPLLPVRHQVGITHLSTVLRRFLTSRLGLHGVGTGSALMLLDDFDAHTQRWADFLR